MRATSIMTFKCLSILHWLHIRCLYRSGRAVVLIPHERVRLSPQNVEKQSRKPQNGGTLGYKKDELHFNYDFQVFAYIELVIYKMFVSFRKCLGTDTTRTSPFTTPKQQKSSSDTPKQRHVRL